MKREKRTVFPFLCLILVPAIWTSCTYDKAEKEVASVRVKTEVVEKSFNFLSDTYVGVVKESECMALGFSVSGMIQEMNVEEGQAVSRGERLAMLDCSSARSALDVAEASLMQAQDAYERMDLLYRNASLPDMKMTEVKAKLQQAEATHAIALKQYRDYELIAPESGFIGKKRLSEGSVVIPGETVCTLLDIDKVKVKIAVPEMEISRINNSYKAYIRVPALNDSLFEGLQIDKNVEADPVTHTYDVYITVDNLEHRLLPGMICSVKLSVADEGMSIFIPAKALCCQNGNQYFVWLAEQGVARRVPVRIGNMSGNEIEIIDGLSGGEYLITEGFQKISNGSKIEDICDGE